MAKAARTIDLGYYPQPKQAEFHRCPGNEVLYGGAAGPGKSHALRFEMLIWCLRIPRLHAYLFRRTFPELENTHILNSQEQFPQGLGVYKEQKRRWEFPNGSMLHFCHAQHEGDIFQYQSAEIHVLGLDELTTFPEFAYDYLRARVRCSLDIPERYRHKVPGIYAATNPGGIGHEFCKRRWVDQGTHGVPFRAPSREGGMLRCYIPARLEDNPILMQRDPGYIDRLNALPEPWRTAYKDGRWDIFMGQMFSFARDHHVIKPRPVPEFAPIYMTFDWGFGKPFSCGWWWVDQDGRLYRFGEWYGWNGTPDQGLRLADSQLAEGIKERERELGIEGRRIERLCGPDCFNKKPDYKGGGQGMSTAEVFAQHGLYLVAGDPSRILKIRQFHERLRVQEDGSAPMLQVYDTCEQFIRTVPLLQADKHNVEDVDTTMEDHCLAGETRVVTGHGVMAIKDLVGKSGVVLTAGGFWTDYRNCRMTKRNAQVVRVAFEDGMSVVCTPDHKFLSVRGEWVEAQDLIDEECHVSIPSEKHIGGELCASSSYQTASKSSTGYATGCVGTISSAGARDFIAWCGSIITDLFQRARTRITETATSATTKLRTWSCEAPLATCPCMGSNPTIRHGQSPAISGRPSGTEAKMAENGMLSTMKSIAGVCFMPNPKRPVNTAKKSSWGSTTPGSVHGNANNATGSAGIGSKGTARFAGASSLESERRALRVALCGWRGTRARAVRVEPAGNTDVYCLVADHTHAFALEGGVVVHNCYDEACHICMARPITSIPKPRPQDEASRLVDFVTGRSRQHPADPAMAENVYAPDVVSSTRAFSISGNNGGGAGKYVDF